MARMGRPPYVVTARDAERAIKFASMGYTDLQISEALDCSESTVEAHYRKEVDEGRALCKDDVQMTAYQMAVSGKHPAMTIFWLKTRCRWREVNRLDIKITDGDKQLTEKINDMPFEKAQELYKELVSAGKGLR